MKLPIKCKNMKKKILWKWKLFWGNIYKIYDKEQKPIRKVLIYHKKIFLLD